jgi:hypothetical protein
LHKVLLRVWPQNAWIHDAGEQEAKDNEDKTDVVEALAIFRKLL